MESECSRVRVRSHRGVNTTVPREVCALDRLYSYFVEQDTNTGITSPLHNLKREWPFGSTLKRSIRVMQKVVHTLDARLILIF